MSRRLWRTLIRELGLRGQGISEAGAFLLSPRGARDQRVTTVAYFDDLDPDALRGGIQLTASAFGKLWDLCDRDEMRVVGDVHTHPGEIVVQSSIDSENPMIGREGHVALIVPRLALRRVVARDVGVHEYRGDAGWESWYGREAARRLHLRRWPRR